MVQVCYSFRFIANTVKIHRCRLAKDQGLLQPQQYLSLSAQQSQQSVLTKMSTRPLLQVFSPRKYLFKYAPEGFSTRRFCILGPATSLVQTSFSS
jgi:hypothetical protein